MNYKEGTIYSGFKLENIKDLHEINSKGLVFTHEKTGAKLIKISNDEDNKVFAITFKTPPEDSTGVAHILEHSVLCGSKKFPSKEPFVELLKSSLNTFLNAMTFADKTMYPIASKNKKDFFNLMDVYLDAVLNPNIYKEKEIFMQEGWHYEIDKETDELKINGVVYNEMKGVYSSPDSIISRASSRSLYPDTTYGNDSGGSPAVIPNLTYDYFVNFHKRYYHPSNSIIFLYGDGDTDEELAFINDNYLNEYSYQNIPPNLGVQEAFEKPKEIKMSYGISNDDEVNNKSYLSLNYSIGRALDRELVLSFEILEYILLTANNALLKNKLINSGIVKVVTGRFEGGIKQPYLNITIKNTDEENKASIINKIDEILTDISKNGIPEDFITGAVNRKEFELREANFGGYPKGLIYGITVLESMLYGGEPFLNLEYTDIIKSIRDKSSKGYFEGLINKYILSNNHKTIISMTPEKGLTEKTEIELKEKLKDIKATFTEDYIENIKKDEEKLRKRQMTPDTKEQLDTLPKLTLEDISKDVEKITLVEKNIEGIKTLFTPMFTNKISYIKLIFDGRVINKEEGQYLALLSFLLGRINTQKRSYEELTNAINMSTGGISYSARSFYKKDNKQDFVPAFVVNGKALSSKISSLLELMTEVVTETSFEDNTRILQIVREIKSRYEGAMVASGNVLGSLRVLSYMSPRGYFEDSIGGIGLYKFICDIEKTLESDPESVTNKLREIADSVFNINNLTISFTEEDENISLIEDNVQILKKGLIDKQVKNQDFNYKLEKMNEGFLTQANINYVTLGGCYLDKGFKYSGNMRVLNTILNFDYLWSKVRVEGGAYGVRVNLSKDGFLYFSSYRDPNIIKTFDAYKGAVEYLKDFNATKEEMVKYIIGTVSKLDVPSNPDSKADKAVVEYYAGYTEEDLIREREQVINTTLEDIKAYGNLIEESLKDNCIVVVGNESQIRSTESTFNHLENLIK